VGEVLLVDNGLQVGMVFHVGKMLLVGNQFLLFVLDGSLVQVGKGFLVGKLYHVGKCLIPGGEVLVEKDFCAGKVCLLGMGLLVGGFLAEIWSTNQ
jgi:hypothetical protein